MRFKFKKGNQYWRLRDQEKCAELVKKNNKKPAFRKKVSITMKEKWILSPSAEAWPLHIELLQDISDKFAVSLTTAIGCQFSSGYTKLFVTG